MLQNVDADQLRTDWQQSRNCLVALEASKVLHQLYVCHIAFLFSALPFLSVLSSGIQNTFVTKHQFCIAQQQVENCASERIRMCDYRNLSKAGSGKFSCGKEITEY